MKTLTMILTSAAAMMTAMPMIAHAAPDAAATAPAAAKHYTTQDTSIGDLLADPAAKAVVDKYIPGLSSSPSISMASGMTLRAIQPMAGDKITVDMLNSIDTDLAKIPAK